MRKFLISAVTAAAAIAATAPASAQSWRVQPAVQRQIQTDINQIDKRIDRSLRNRIISPREATGLRRDAAGLQRLYYNYRRNGLDRYEVARLESEVNRLHQRLRVDRRDWDGRRG